MHQIISTEKIEDNRGYFLKLINTFTFSESFITQSLPNTFRGFHFNGNNNLSSRVIHVLEGEIIDVLIDLRKESFGKVYKLSLNNKNENTALLPWYCAHGFYSRSGAKLIYFFEKNYKAEEDLCINYNSFNEFSFIKDFLMSERDKTAKDLNFYREKYFNYT